MVNSKTVTFTPKFNLGDKVWFIGDREILSGEVVAVHHSNFDSKIGYSKYRKKGIRGVSYGVQVLVDYFAEKYKIVDIQEDSAFTTEVELAQNLLNEAQKR